MLDRLFLQVLNNCVCKILLKTLEKYLKVLEISSTFEMYLSTSTSTLDFLQKYLSTSTSTLKNVLKYRKVQVHKVLDPTLTGASNISPSSLSMSLCMLLQNVICCTLQFEGERDNILYKGLARHN
jgi:hypothetical protein